MKKTIRLIVILLLSARALSAQWTQITNIPIPPFTVNYVSDMEIDGSTLYAIGDNNLYKGVNNGASWTKIYSIDNYSMYLNQVEAAGNTVCFTAYDANTYTPLFFYSNDGGATFQQGGPDFIYVDALFVQANKIFVLDDSGFYVSDDQGATFTNTGLLPPAFYSADIKQTPIGKILLYTTLDPNTFLPTDAYAYLSTDDVNWTPMNTQGGSNPLPAGEVYWSSIGYLNGTLFFGGYNPFGTGALYKSTDMGTNWYPVNNSIFQEVGFVTAFGTNRAYAAGNNGYNTSTDGANWTTTNTPSNTYPADGVGAKFAAGGSSGTWLSVNSGANWAKTAGQIETPNYDVIYDYLSAGNTKFLVTQWHGIYRGTGSDPANLTWTKVLGADVNNGGNMGWDILQKGNTLLAGIDFFGGGQQGIYRSTNNGTTWTRTFDGAGLCFFDDGNAIYAGVDYQGVLKSTNQGQTWTAMNNGFPPIGNFLSPSEILRAGNNLVVSFFFGGIYTSSNGGNSWTQASFESLVYCMAKSGSTLFAGTQHGLMKSTDQGQTWEYIQNDLYNNTAVTSLYVQEDDALYIGTGNQGLYFSADLGETLESVNDGAGDNNYVSFIGRDGSKMLAGWNYAPVLFSAYYYIGSNYGRGLWYQNAGNPRPPSPTDRASIQTSEPNLTIFPNPVQDVLQFSLNTDPERVANLQIVNAKGETVREEQGPVSRPALQVQNLSNGAYFLKVTLQDGTSLVRRFMVVRGR